MVNKMLGSLSDKFYLMVAILVFTVCVLVRLIIRLLQNNSNKKIDKQRVSKTTALWKRKDLQKTIDAGLVKKQPGWTKTQKEKAKKLELLNDRVWRQDEVELARKNGLLSHDKQCSHAEFQKAKQLNLI